MKIIAKNKNSSFNNDIGEAFIEVTPDGSHNLQAVMHKTGKVIKYCSFNPEHPFDLSEMNSNINYLMDQIDLINERIDNIEITSDSSGIYVGSDTPTKSCIWYDTDTTDEIKIKD